MSAVTATDSRWFRELAPDSGDRPLLVCLPYAGGGASIYRTWSTLFAGDFHVAAVQLPGRETRVQETPEVDVESIATAIAARVEGRPYALFGHSMGGRIAFEVTRILEQRGADLPGLAVISAARPPHTLPDGPLDQISKLPDARLVARLRRSGSVPDAVLDEPELLDLFLPVFRADFTWVDQTAEAGLDPERAPAPVAAPVLSLAGTFDEVATFEQVGQWDRWTTAEHRGQVLPGGHFFLDEQANAVRDAVVGAWRDLARGSGATAVGRSGPAPHHVEVGGLRLWRDCMVRTAMLPAADLDRLARPDVAAVADRVVAGGAEGVEARRELERLLADPTPGLDEIAAHPLLREALAWQNPAVLDTADKLADTTRTISRRARREAVIGRYWQRYAAKNETIGFFGPVTWALLDPQRATSSAVPGSALCRERRTRLEGWAIRELADRLCSHWGIRGHLVPRRSPLIDFDLAAAEARRVPRPPVSLGAAEVSVLRAVDGRRTGEDVLRACGLPADRARQVLDHLTSERRIWWPSQVAPDPFAQQRFERVLASLPDTGDTAHVRGEWRRVLDRVKALEVAAGDADRVRAAAVELERVFHDVTGADVSRRPGEMYVGRRIFYEDTARDVEVVIGADVLEPLAEVLRPLRRAARWLCAELDSRYAEALDELCDDLDDGTGSVDAGELFFLVIGLLFGTTAQVADDVAQEFASRFARVLQVPGDPDVERIDIDPAEFARRVEAAFPQRRTDWTAARIHSPDVQVVAPDLDTIRRGEAQIVLGEVHAAWATLDVAAFHPFHEEPERLRRGLRHDAGRRRPRISFPPSWPRATTRTTQVLLDEEDTEVVWDDDSGADATREVALTELSIRRDGAKWRVFSRPDHPNAPTEGWSLVELFSDLVSVHAVDGFKLLAREAYVPRVTIGRVTLVRRTWRTSVADTGLADASTPLTRVVAARALRRRMSLPEQVYVSVQGETKPVYCDWRSPVYVQGLATMLRSARERSGEDAAVVIGEALPAPDQAWFPDAEGRTYFSEVRMQLIDDEVVDA